jgi:hypothetical protein
MLRRSLIPLGLIWVLAGCTEIDDTVTFDLGASRPSLADSDLATQTVVVGVDVPRTIQWIRWNSVTRFEVDGLVPDKTCDLAVPACEGSSGVGECAFLDTALAAARADGRCAGGVIVNSDDEAEPRTVIPQAVRLSEVRVSRLAPIVLPDAEDYDADGVMNAMDNCVLIDNPDQQDSGGKGFGDACTATDPFLGTPFVDNDADGVPDIVDNCPFTPNPDQEDDGIEFGGFTVPDGIGNACSSRQQTATVQLGMNSDILLDSLPSAMGVQPLRANSWLTVDFNDQAALDCDWDAGTCQLTASALRFCFNTTGGLICP